MRKKPDSRNEESIEPQCPVCSLELNEAVHPELKLENNITLLNVKGLLCSNDECAQQDGAPFVVLNMSGLKDLLGSQPIQDAAKSGMVLLEQDDSLEWSLREVSAH